jgi:hypothetical protein
MAVLSAFRLPLSSINSPLRLPTIVLRRSLHPFTAPLFRPLLPPSAPKGCASALHPIHQVLWAVASTISAMLRRSLRECPMLPSNLTGLRALG